MIALDDDCLAEIISYLSHLDVIHVASTCKRLYSLIQSTSLVWEHTRISGQVIPTTKFIEHFLIKKSHFVQYLTFDNIVMLPEGVGDEMTRYTLQLSLMQALETLLKRIGTRLKCICLIEDEEGCLLGDSRFFELVAKYSTALEALSIDGFSQSDALSDEIMLLLTTSCPLVTKFKDYRAFGPTIRGLHYAFENWTGLDYLIVNTDHIKLATFIKILKKVGNRLRMLGFTCFMEPLQPNFTSLLLPVLEKLSLNELRIDLELANTSNDGLMPNDLQSLQIERFYYTAGVLAYFETDTSKAPSRMAGSLQFIDTRLEFITIMDQIRKILESKSIKFNIKLVLD